MTLQDSKWDGDRPLKSPQAPEPSQTQARQVLSQGRARRLGRVWGARRWGRGWGGGRHSQTPFGFSQKNFIFNSFFGNLIGWWLLYPPFFRTRGSTAPLAADCACYVNPRGLIRVDDYLQHSLNPTLDSPLLRQDIFALSFHPSGLVYLSKAKQFFIHCKCRS